MTTRLLFLICVGLAALALLNADGEPTEPGPANVKVAATGPKIVAAAQVIPHPSVQRASAEVTTSASQTIDDYNAEDPFAPKTWGVTPAVAAASPPPPPVPDPVAPPLPFRLVGKLDAGANQIVYYLANHNQDFPVQVGETFAGVYRLDTATAEELAFTYLPLQTTQTLSISE